MALTCKTCDSADLTKINTYKRWWYACHSCGDARPEQKTRYSMSWLPGIWFGKSNVNEEAMYDYFVEPSHIAYSIETAKEFSENHLKANGISLAGKSILDISGGNGHFITEIARAEGATAALTEINDLTIEYARKTHGIPVYKFNFQDHRLSDVVTEKYDVIMPRAAIMFCDDLDRFAEDCAKVLNSGGLLFVSFSVIPCMGVFVRVQLDEFSYFVLRQPENVVATFCRHGFDLVKSALDPDLSMYAYDHDKNKWWQFASNLYMIPGVRKLRVAELAGKNGFTFRARDRRRATMIFRKGASTEKP